MRDQAYKTAKGMSLAGYILFINQKFETEEHCKVGKQFPKRENESEKTSLPLLDDRKASWSLNGVIKSRAAEQAGADICSEYEGPF